MPSTGIWTIPPVPLNRKKRPIGIRPSRQSRSIQPHLDSELPAEDLAVPRDRVVFAATSETAVVAATPHRDTALRRHQERSAGQRLRQGQGLAPAAVQPKELARGCRQPDEGLGRTVGKVRERLIDAAPDGGESQRPSHLREKGRLTGSKTCSRSSVILPMPVPSPTVAPAAALSSTVNRSSPSTRSSVSVFTLNVRVVVPRRIAASPMRRV